ncbi:hypothetical protein SYNPS1DRAFT_28739 [Syncephalis pseudoplumigaleata]|uniref:Uncharacterized protein n=1 Tax=Syncephalis pseudoplumigaleata TaxID=1712513 RepID=A0A4P9Z0V6_9FUNG|nr:hypothetical protein SYNPS1DRAFT_28739 [Syncephalis pseudoplumigaleata]|eukprot:RKP25532.1 hypothetical protein SYNPS1DRAFT_28739 [Syncephalis pseudoplumigaleata]
MSFNGRSIRSLVVVIAACLLVWPGGDGGARVADAVPGWHEVSAGTSQPCGLIDGTYYRCALPLACQRIPSQSVPVCVVPVDKAGDYCDNVVHKCMNFLQCQMSEDASFGQCVEEEPQPQQDGASQTAA